MTRSRSYVHADSFTTLQHVQFKISAINTHACFALADDCPWSPGENDVALVDPGRHKGVHQRRSRLRTECTPDESKLLKMVEAIRADVGNMFLKTD